MTYVKTAISLQEALLKKMDDMAQQLDISRSRLFALAAEDFLQRHQNEELLQALNAAYDDLPDPAEETHRQSMRRQHRQMVTGQW
jgi:metal-responsive CopG/Arc/MetJ family transcriptional regulator